MADETNEVTPLSDDVPAPEGEHPEIEALVASLDEEVAEAVAEEPAEEPAEASEGDEVAADADDEVAADAAEPADAEAATADGAEAATAEAAEGPTAEVAEAEAAATESLDDIPITPGVTGDAEAALEGVSGTAARVPWWPFLVYLGIWLVLAGLAVWQFLELPAKSATYEAELYGTSIMVGMALVAIGPALAIAVWLFVWLGAEKGRRTGLLTSALIKGAVVTLGGVAIWWIALLLVDYLRLGRLY
jgi:hypothetical protein